MVPTSDERRAQLHRRVRLIVSFSIAWNVAEAVIAITAGGIASSAALIGFGLDSVVEVGASAAVAWQFTRNEPERWERATVRAIAVAFFALAAYLAIDAVLALSGVDEVQSSLLGIGLTASSLVVMPGLAWLTFRTGRELSSRSVEADAQQLLFCVYLSGAVLLGLALNALFGWAWSDSVAALFIAALAIREGIATWRGEPKRPSRALKRLAETRRSGEPL